MASVSSFGSWEWITSNDELQGMQISDVDLALIKSFEEITDDQKLQSMIQFDLEAAVDPNMKDDVDQPLVNELAGHEFDFGVCSVEDLGLLEDCKDCWGSSFTFPTHDDFDWVDNETSSWYMGLSADELLDIFEFGKAGDYSQFYNEAVHLQEPYEQSSIWQETFDTVM